MSTIKVKPSELQELLAAAIPAKLPILITGRPGIGKSDIVTQACEQAGFKLIISHPVVSDPTDFKGLPFASSDTEASFLPFGDLAQLVKATEPTVFFLDDLGQAPPAVQAACMQLLLARRVNGHKVADCVCFVAATNRRQDRAGVTGMLEPVKSRFASIVELDFDLNDWVSWALTTNLPTDVIAFMRLRSKEFEKFEPTTDLTNSPSPRTLHNLARLQVAGIESYAAFAGAVGEGMAAEYIGFRQIMHNMVSPDLILLNPDTAPVPDDAATLYALTLALARKASTQTFDRLCRYFNRLPAEFSVLAVRDAAQLCPDVVSSRAFIEWASKNADVLI